MSKKEFKTGLDGLFEPTVKRVNSINQDSPQDKRVEPKTKEVRATFIVKEEQLIFIKAIAYWDRKQIKMLLAEIIDFYKGQYDENYIQDILTAYRKL
jgi:hypothetical protein